MSNPLHNLDEPHFPGDIDCPGCIGVAMNCRCGGIIHKEAWGETTELLECDECHDEYEIDGY